MSESIVRHEFKGKPIRQRIPDNYVCLTDMAKAGSWSLEAFLKTPRYHETVAVLYQMQSGQIRHLVEVDGDDCLWADLQVAISFSYFIQHCDHEGIYFDIWFSRNFQPLLARTDRIGEVFSEAAASFHEMPCQQILAAARGITFDKAPLTRSRVYFILNATKKQVKIGYSGCPEARLKAFQCGTTDKLSIVLTMPGDIKKEKEVHTYFAEYRIKSSEIFRYDGELKEYLKPYIEAA